MTRSRRSLNGSRHKRVINRNGNGSVLSIDTNLVLPMVKPGRYEEKKRGPAESTVFELSAIGESTKGVEQLRAELFEQITACLGTHHSGRKRIETAPTKAEGILARELSRRSWTAGDLSHWRKREEAKSAMARRLRHERTMACGSQAAICYVSRARGAPNQAPGPNT